MKIELTAKSIKVVMSQSEFAKCLGIGAIGHENRTYFKANKSCDELIDENSEFTERLEIGAF